VEGLQPTFAYQITAMLLLSTLYEPLRKQLISVLVQLGEKKNPFCVRPSRPIMTPYAQTTLPEE